MPILAIDHLLIRKTRQKLASQLFQVEEIMTCRIKMSSRVHTTNSQAGPAGSYYGNQAPGLVIGKQLRTQINNEWVEGIAGMCCRNLESEFQVIFLR